MLHAPAPPGGGGGAVTNLRDAAIGQLQPAAQQGMRRQHPCRCSSSWDGRQSAKAMAAHTLQATPGSTDTYCHTYCRLPLPKICCLFWTRDMKHDRYTCLIPTRLVVC